MAQLMGVKMGRTDVTEASKSLQRGVPNCCVSRYQVHQSRNGNSKREVANINPLYSPDMCRLRVGWGFLSPSFGLPVEKYLVPFDSTNSRPIASDLVYQLP
jgi:hypothetical protein